MNRQHRPSQASKTGILDSRQYGIIAVISITFLVISCCTFPAAAQPEHSSSQKAAELENLRNRIKDVESSIQAARDETEQLFKELQTNEMAISNISGLLRDIDQDIENKVLLLAELKVKKDTSESSLTEERQQLSQQIRAAYKTGKNDYLKLLLNQENPALVGRMLSYYDYYNKARTARIKNVTETLREITSLEQQIRTETRQLDDLRTEQLLKLEEFTRHKISRKKVITRLQDYINRQDKHLQILQQNEEELESLVNRLRDEESTVQTFEDIPPFESLKGQLKWPARGTITTRYGALRKGGKLKWQGVTISASNGTDVEAISPGKIVFADWFRNMGLLIIIDHGRGYMSLYGHNERLLKKVGDWVSEGESIAKVGDTGGQQQSNLYFEIRYSGDPVNPGLWCRG